MSISLLASADCVESTPRGRALPRVLVVTPIYPWAGNPNEGVFVQRQVRELARLGHECRVLVYHGAIPRLPREAVSLSWLRYHPRSLTWARDRYGIAVSHSFYARAGGQDVVPEIVDTLAASIERQVDFQRSDVIYGHWLWTGGAVALGLRDRFGWPVAAIARGGDMHRWQHIHPHCREHVERVITQADLILANCNALGERIADHNRFAASRVKVIYNGCDSTTFRPNEDKPSIRAALGLRPGIRYMLTCASIARHKGMTELASAWRHFSADHPHWRLLVIGTAVERDQVSLLRRLGRHGVTLLGAKSPDVVRSYMQAADAYAQPSREEGLANATMEAMASGLPVIGTAVGGQSEILESGHNGWLIPRNSPEALLRAMRELAADLPGAGERGREARRTIEHRFNPTVHARALSALLDGMWREEPAQIA